MRLSALDAQRATNGDLAPFVDLNGWARKRDLDMASAACLVSHRNALARFLRETDASAALILEDDVKLSRDLPGFMDACEHEVSGVRLLKLCVNPGNPRERALGSPVGPSRAAISGR